MLSIWDIIFLMLGVILTAFFVSTLVIVWEKDDLEKLIERKVRLDAKPSATFEKDALSYNQRADVIKTVRYYIDAYAKFTVEPLKEDVKLLQELVKYQGHSIYKLKNNPAVREGALRKAILDKEGELGDLQEELEALKGFKAEGTE